MQRHLKGEPISLLYKAIVRSLYICINESNRLTRQRNIFIAAMENYDKVLKYTAESENALGTASKKYSAYTDSIQAHLNNLTSTWQEFVNNMNASGTFNGVVDILSGLVKTLDTLLNKFKLMKVMIPISASILFLDIISKLSDKFKSFKTGFIDTGTVLATFNRKVSSGSTSVKKLSKTISSLTKEQKIAIVTHSKLNDKTKKAILIRSELSKAEAEAAVSTNGLGLAAVGTTGKVSMLSAAWEHLKLAFMSNPIGFIITGITTAISLLVPIVQGINEEFKESIRIGAENASKYKEQSGSIKELTDKYTELNDELIKNSGNTEKINEIKTELLDVQNQLNDLYGEEHDQLRLVNGDYGEQIQKIKKLNKEKAESFKQENLSSYKDAEKELNKTKTYTYEVLGKPVFDVKYQADEAEEKLRELYEEIGKSGLKFSKIIQEQISQDISELVQDTTIQEAKELREQYQMATLVSSDNKGYEQYISLTNAIKEYNKALADGTSDEIKNTRSMLEEAINASDEFIKSGSGVDTVFNNLLNTINTDRESYIKFRDSIAESNDLNKLKEDLEELSEAEIEGLGGNGAFDNIVLNAKEAGFNIQQVIQMLRELGVIATDTREPFLDMTSEINSALEDLKEKVSETGIKLKKEMDFSEFSHSTALFADEIIQLESSYNTLLDAVDEFNIQGFISAQTFKSLSENDLLQYLDTTNGKLTANTDALFDNSESIRENAIQSAKLVALKQIQEIVTEAVSQKEQEATGSTDAVSSSMEVLSPILDKIATGALDAAGAMTALHNSLEGKNIDASYINGVENQIKKVLNSFSSTINYIDKIGNGITGITRKVKSGAGSATSAMKDMKNELKEQEEILKNEKKAIEDLIDALIKMKKQQLKEEKELLKKEKELKNKDYEETKKQFEKEKREQDRYFEDRKDEIEKLKDLESDLYDNRIESLDKELDAYQKKIDKEKELLQQKKKEQDYEKDLAKKVQDVSKIQSELDALQFDDSLEAQKKKLELSEQLAEKQESLDEFQSEHSYELKEDALDKELDRFEEVQQSKKDAIEEEKESFEDYWEEKLEALEEEQKIWDRNFEDRKIEAENLHEIEINNIEEKIQKKEEEINNEKELRLEAIHDIDTNNQEAYNNLIEWNRTYGTGIDKDIKDKWKTAQDALIKYNGTCNGTQSILEHLSGELITINDRIKEIDESAKNASGGFDGWTNSIEDAKDGIADLKREMSHMDNYMVDFEGNKYKPDTSTYNGYSGKPKHPIPFHHKGTNYVSSDSKDKAISKSMGLKQDEVVRILQVGEAVIPKDQNLSGISGSNIINSSTQDRVERMSKSYKNYLSNDNSVLNIEVGDITIEGGSGNITTSDLKDFRDSIINEMFKRINKHTNLSGFRTVKGFV